MSTGFPDYAGQALSFASFYLRPGPRHMEASDVEQALMRRYPNLQPSELGEIMYLAERSAQAAAAWNASQGGETLAEIAGVPGGASVRVVYRIRWGGEQPSNQDVYQMRETVASLDTPQSILALAAEQLAHTQMIGSDPPPEEEMHIELFQIDFFPELEEDFPEF